MPDTILRTVVIHLPKELVVKLEEMKKDRAEDCEKPVETLVRELCQDYIDVREMARDEAARKEDLERSYRDDPNDWDDTAMWAESDPPAGSKTPWNAEKFGLLTSPNPWSADRFLFFLDIACRSADKKSRSLS
jgi:hypothetical protein